MAYRNATQPKKWFVEQLWLGLHLNKSLNFIHYTTYIIYNIFFSLFGFHSVHSFCAVSFFVIRLVILSSVLVYSFFYALTLSLQSHSIHECVWNWCWVEWKEWQQQRRQNTATFINIHKLKCSRKVFCILIIDGTHDVILFNFLPLLLHHHLFLCAHWFNLKPHFSGRRILYTHRYTHSFSFLFG